MLANHSESGQKLEGGHGKRFSGEREHNRELRGWGAWKEDEK